jgi:hypothetical protein
VPDAVAAVIGITQQPGKSVAESVATALEGRIRLLVFDNCEHVLNAVADLVESILAHSATVKALATSREGVGLADEQLWPVPSLDVDSAVDLFLERAHRVAPSFSVDDASAVAGVCRRLDGARHDSPALIQLLHSPRSHITRLGRGSPEAVVGLFWTSACLAAGAGLDAGAGFLAGLLTTTVAFFGTAFFGTAFFGVALFAAGSRGRGLLSC